MNDDANEMSDGYTGDEDQLNEMSEGYLGSDSERDPKPPPPMSKTDERWLIGLFAFVTAIAGAAAAYMFYG